MNLLNLIFGPLSVEKTADKIIDKTLNSSFKIFSDDKIRQLLKFCDLEQTEQDRIFNEFVVMGLALVYLMIETVCSVTEKEKHEFYKELKNLLPAVYLKRLAGFGIEKKYVDIWGKLFEMRSDEYRQKRNEYRGEVPEPAEGNPWIGIVAIGGLHHLRRGKTSPDDQLFKHLLSWLTSLAIDAEKILIRAF